MTTLAKPTVNHLAMNAREGGLILQVIGGATAIPECRFRSALLRWLEPGRGEPIRPGTLQITRASSANASARRAVGGTSVPRS
jgi:hypothetical protein